MIQLSELYLYFAYLNVWLPLKFEWYRIRDKEDIVITSVACNSVKEWEMVMAHDLILGTVSVFIIVY